MKRKSTVIILIISIPLSVCLTLLSINFISKIKDSRDFAKEFCYSIVEDDYDSAKQMLHSDGKIKQEDLENYILKIEKKYNMDFSNGIVFKKITDYSHTAYDGEYNGSVHIFTYQIVVNDLAAEASFTIVDNKNGYGIYNFTLNY